MNWTDILGNVASGGVLGLLGTGLNFALGYFQRKQEHAQRMAWAVEQRETLRLQGELTAAQTAGEVAVARERGAADAFTASQQADSKVGSSYRWVDAVRGLTRPALTLILLALTCIFYFNTDEATMSYIAQNVVVTSVAAVTWWFGQRQLDRSTTSWGAGSVRAQVSSKPTS